MDTAKRIVEEGHVIGNHTYDHPFLLIQSKVHIKYEIEKAEQAIFKATHTKPHLFRPPYGVTDNWIYHTVKEHGYVKLRAIGDGAIGVGFRALTIAKNYIKLGGVSTKIDGAFFVVQLENGENRNGSWMFLDPE